MEIAALLIAIGSAAVAAIGWLKVRDMAALAAGQIERFRQQAKTSEAELAHLRSELNATEERLRSRLARELAREESALRVQAELRLKMFTLGAHAVGDCRRAISTWLGTLPNLLMGVAEHRKNTELLPAVEQANKVVRDAGTMLPPELDSAWNSCSRELTHGSMEILGVARLDALEERRKKCAEIGGRLGTLASQFTVAALRWKAEEWRRVEHGSRDVDATQPQQAKTDGG
jgi:hypothetical protein